MVRTGEEAGVSAEIRDGAVQSLYLENLPILTSKKDFELNSNIHLRHSCNQNMQILSHGVKYERKHRGICMYLYGRII